MHAPLTPRAAAPRMHGSHPHEAHRIFTDHFIAVGDHVIRRDAIDLLQAHGLTSFRHFVDCGLGESVARKRGRAVVRIELGERTFFLKRNYFSVHERLKNLIRFRWNPPGALEEADSILAIARLGIPTVPLVAFGARRVLGTELESFLVTEALYGFQPLEKIVEQRCKRPLSQQRLAEKRSMIARTARLARAFHGAGLSHQDFYLGHLFLHPSGTMAIIDVQRLRHRASIPLRHRVKDLGQLCYSALGTGHVTSADCLRFLRVYLGKHRFDSSDAALIRKIDAKRRKIARHTVRLLRKRRQRGELLG